MEGGYVAGIEHIWSYVAGFKHTLQALNICCRLQTYVAGFKPMLQALNGFLMILDCQGELFFATHSIETYLGFHQVTRFILNFTISRIFQNFF